MSFDTTLAYHYTLMKSKKNKNNLCPIYLRIIINKTRVSLSTNKSINENQWLNQKGILSADDELNKFLASLERKLINTYNNLINADKEVSAQILKDELQGKKKKVHSVISVFEYHNENMKSLIGKKYAKGTLKNYRSTLKYMREFIPKFYNVSDIPIHKLNYQFAKNYELFLTIEKNCTNNGVMKQMQRLKKITNLSIANEWLDKDPFIKFIGLPL